MSLGPRRVVMAMAFCALASVGWSSSAGKAAAHQMSAGHGTFLAVVTHGEAGVGEAELLSQRGTVLRSYGRAVFDGTAQWSASRKIVAWLAPSGVMVANADGSDSRLVVPVADPCVPPTDGSCTTPSFNLSPQGTKLLVANYGPQTDELVIASVSTGTIRDVEPPRANVSYAVGLGSWSPGGRWFTFGLSGPHRWGLFVTRANGTDTRLLSRAAGASSVSWSPNGRLIAYASDSNPPNTPATGVITLADDGKVTPAGADLHPGVAQVPAWSPNSRRVAFTQYDGPAASVTVAGGATHDLGARGVWEAWTARGLFVLSRDRRTVLWSPDGLARLRPLFRISRGHGQIPYAFEAS